MMDIAKLRELAMAAQRHSEQIGEDEWFPEDVVRSMMLAHPADAAYIEAASPDVMVKLLDERDRLLNVADKARVILRRFSANDLDALRSALQALDPEKDKR